MQLRQHEEAFRRLNTQVITVSFTHQPDFARAWRQDTGSPFPFLLDPSRATYADYDLIVSLIGGWSPRTVLYYARAILTGTRFIWFEDDTRQLGGDFIVDSSGVIRYAYRSAESADRPPVASLIHVLES